MVNFVFGKRPRVELLSPQKMCILKADQSRLFVSLADGGGGWGLPKEYRPSWNLNPHIRQADVFKNQQTVPVCNVSKSLLDDAHSFLTGCPTAWALSRRASQRAAAAAGWAAQAAQDLFAGLNATERELPRGLPSPGSTSSTGHAQGVFAEHLSTLRSLQRARVWSLRDESKPMRADCPLHRGVSQEHAKPQRTLRHHVGPLGCAHDCPEHC